MCNQGASCFPSAPFTKFIAVATSAVAVALLDGGRTAHSTFKIPILINYGRNCNVSASSQLARQLLEADLILCDEAVITHKHCIGAVHRMLQDVTKCTLLFRGKAFMLIDCFRQILPVIKGGSRSEIVNAFMKTSELLLK